MRGSIRCALGAALLAVIAVPVVAGATDQPDGAPAEVVAPAVDVAPTAPPSTEVVDEATPPADEPVATDDPAAAPVAPEPAAVVEQQACDPNYFGACVPAGVGDVDCSDLQVGGFISIGVDPYGLDGDGDGYACESNDETPVSPETTVPPTTAPPTTAPPTTAPPTSSTPPTTTPPTTSTSTPPATTAPQVANAVGGCHPSYVGACVPVDATDVDCGQIAAVDVRVVGPDQYRLDGDSDGVACESGATPVAQVLAATVTRTSTSSLATTGSSTGLGVVGVGLLLAGLTLVGGGMLLTHVGPWRTRGGFTVVRYDRYCRERRTRVVNDRI